eukprot:TRINITY_DN2930_c0_g1_i1.p1 TRINITY_DN2930_c0_g1~~TRINITY_DN2930_c0_g1_i1.p1  ORF type:complete len:436 (-),score=209.69 TRINITY_DN2930_c0_g1_i1:51-1316(-)
MDRSPDKSFCHAKKPIGLGVLIANLGSPSVCTAQGLRSFYAEFLADRRVIEVPRIIWNCILYGFILPFRPYAILPQYKKVWTDEGSPLLVISEQQKVALQARLDKTLGAGNALVAVGMRYGQPSLAGALEELKAAGCERLIVLPLYPQPAAPTSGSTFDALGDAMRSWRHVPPVRFVAGYADEPAFVQALARSVRQFWAANGGDAERPQRLLISFHGVPRSTLLAGDPYHCWCVKTARLLADELALPHYADTDGAKARTNYAISFQSRFGFAEWVRPYSDASLEQFGDDGLETVDIIAPAFSADCLETLEEITIQLAETFHEHGGKRLRYIPALNADDDAIALYEQLVLRNALGWPEQHLMSAECIESLAPSQRPRTEADCIAARRRANALAAQLEQEPLAADTVDDAGEAKQTLKQKKDK